MHRWHFNTFHQWFNMTNDFPTFASFSFRSYLPSCLPSRNLVFHISWCSFFQDQNALLPPPTGPTLQTLFPETFQLSTFVYTVVLYVTVLCRVVLCCVCVLFPYDFPSCGRLLWHVSLHAAFGMFGYFPALGTSQFTGNSLRGNFQNSGGDDWDDWWLSGGEIVQRPYPARDV